ncbi:UPF0014-domain-containing protein [Gloeophyllum trabeum ATCC 11539]|uniref:UPF0014-domain-containing protein n=1 Tax=Gloeophyllum trabeum (strain ATCC 11539 / FP-39264 / Madison 617) TaxID=670483 RepID=S7RIX7_GLOTA|nr:UPF0014-domain-containing protein [Gloeophyllum trabeum ATCC 11539]EPQ52554.1 UPF0014-domain-containing protein [Gloeophyllum trabeum ATCC 11539]
MDVGDSPVTDRTHLTYLNVALGLSFIAFNSFLSYNFRLGVGSALFTAALRCIIQLAIMSLLLKQIFETNNPWAVAGLACLLNVLGTTETVINKSKRRFEHMFPSVLISMMGATVPVSLIGSRFAMGITPFWTPDQYVPIIGMLCGGTVSGINVAVSYALKELHENKDKVEVYLAFGASRFEASKPIVREALRLALTPNINQLSVIGMISIPGMMTGAILGGSSVEQAAKLQMVIMFMISSCTALSSIVSSCLAMTVMIDGEHRIRSDRMDTRPHAVWRARKWLSGKGKETVAMEEMNGEDRVGLLPGGNGGRTMNGRGGYFLVPSA